MSEWKQGEPEDRGVMYIARDPEGGLYTVEPVGRGWVAVGVSRGQTDWEQGEWPAGWGHRALSGFGQPTPKAYESHTAAPSGNEWTWLPGHALWRRVEDWHDAPATVGRDDLDAYDAAHPMSGDEKRREHVQQIDHIDKAIRHHMGRIAPLVDADMLRKGMSPAEGANFAEIVERLTAARANLIAAGPSPE